MALGLVGIATTGRSLTRALLLSSALSWNLGGKQKIPVRAMAVVVGIIVGVAVIAAIMNRIRDATGIAVASVAFTGVAAVYGVLWSVLYMTLPRGTSDPGAALPGASIVAVVLACLQAVTQLYLPRQIEQASSLYGSLGVGIAGGEPVLALAAQSNGVAEAPPSNADTRMPSGKVPQYPIAIPALPRKSISNQVAGNVVSRNTAAKIKRNLSTEDS